MRPLMALGSPAPSTMVVLSLSTLTCLAWPSISKVASFSSMPTSEEMTVPPVRTAMSSSMAFLRSPKPGALTATQLKEPRSLLTTRVARASPSTSSAMISSFRPFCTTCSRRGRISWMLEIFLSVIRMAGLSSTASILSVLVTM